MLKRIWLLLISRNKEFYRDKSGFGWNILFPFLIIVGFSLLFSQDGKKQYKIGIITGKAATSEIAEQISRFRKTGIFDFVDIDSINSGITKLSHHRIDLLIDEGSGRFWNSTTSPKGLVAEKALIASGFDPAKMAMTKEEVQNIREIPYIEWLFPGILAMNMMFSALFGVGYTVVRYRKNGVLKRLSVTPLSAFEFLSSQILSRLFVIIITTLIVYVGCYLIYGFTNRGSYLLLLSVFILGSLSMISLSLTIASRSSSEEFAGGILNLISWPMMFLSEVWFSLEGARPGVRVISKFFPLSHLTESARMIMNDGAGLYEIRYNIMALAGMSVFFLLIGSILFKWQKDE